MKNLTTHTRCRACRAILPRNPVFSLGDMPLIEFPDTPQGTRTPTPVDLMECPVCGLVQLRHSVDPDELYRNFWYRSAITHSMRSALQDVVKGAMKYVDLKPGDAVIDIGANDGTLLSFIPEETVKIGCDPSINLREKLEQNADIVITDFWSSEAYEEAIKKYQQSGSGETKEDK